MNRFDQVFPNPNLPSAGLLLRNLHANFNNFLQLSVIFLTVAQLSSLFLLCLKRTVSGHIS